MFTCPHSKYFHVEFDNSNIGIGTALYPDWTIFRTQFTLLAKYLLIMWQIVWLCYCSSKVKNIGTTERNVLMRNHSKRMPSEQSYDRISQGHVGEQHTIRL